jgi:predicted amidohydrolase
MVRIAVAQPLAHDPGASEKNVPGAVAFVKKAAAEGAHFVCFPESYPGPWRMPAHFDPTPALAAAAAEHKIHVVFGTLEPINVAKATAYNLICMAYPDGRVVKYRRTHPNGPWIYTGGGAWEFQYTAGSDYPVFETQHGVVGLAMCSEVYMPEVTRALALRGAEIIFLPAGTQKRKLHEGWRTLLWARAIENLAIVVSTQNLLNANQRGLAIVAAPERIVFESEAAGLFCVDADLARVRELRNGRDSVNASESCGAKQGILGPQWQRTELYDTFYPKPEIPEAAE